MTPSSEAPAVILRGLGLAGQKRPLAAPVRSAPPALPRADVPVPASVEAVTVPVDPAALEQARHEAAQQGWAEGRRDGFEAGRALGFEQGLAEGRSAGADEAVQRSKAGLERQTQLVGRLEQLLTALPTQFQEQLTSRLRAGEDDMILLVHAIICRLIGDLAVKREAAAHIVRHAVSQLAGANAQASVVGALAIHLHPQDLSLLQADPELAEWLARRRGGLVQWRADDTIKLGGCIVQSGEGGVDARLETQLAALRMLLLNTRAAREKPAGPPQTRGDA